MWIIVLYGLIFLSMLTVTFLVNRRLDREGIEPEPDPVSIEKKIQELEQWNTSWTHPELGSEFYHWDEQQKKYVEGKKRRSFVADPIRNPPRGPGAASLPTWKRDDPDLPERAKRNVRNGVAGCRCDKLPEGMICSLCFFL